MPAGGGVATCSLPYLRYRASLPLGEASGSQKNSVFLFVIENKSFKSNFSRKLTNTISSRYVIG